MDITYHYPPDLLQLLVDAIPRLCKAKRDVLIFFRGAGVGQHLLRDLERRVEVDRQNINKFEIARTVLTRLNERGEPALRERREVLKRVVEIEDFSICWQNDRLEAQGLVARIRSVVHVKDSFARMQQERENELAKHRALKEKESQEKARKVRELAEVRQDFYRLFGEKNARKRGLALESALNRLFLHSGILIQEDFKRCGEPGEGIIEQIDGVVEFGGRIYLVEMKWLKDSAGTGDVSTHLVRVYAREGVGGIFISYSDFSPGAIRACKEALAQRVVFLCKLQEFVNALEQGADLKNLLNKKAQAAIVQKEPLSFVLTS